MSVIEQMGFADYFLIVQDYVGFAKRAGIPVGPGRGSGAGSLVAFLLGITDVDSIRMICCLSVSLIQSVSVCPILISTSATIAAMR